ncbi:hypothetical protein [Endozoicomonas arenosclerae]|uniref:hypothetical protein n=1 Tax=Endozoicomonas arenosclerae TaxID=1633495 RepID=UPI000784D0B9|nr:hypothetical protein [Endozoicomonas arenosclerae]
MPVHFNPGQSQPVQPIESAKAGEEPASSQGIVSSAPADRASSPRSHPLRQRRAAAVRPLPLTRWQKLSLVIRLGIKPPPIKVEDRKLHLDCSKDNYQAELYQSLTQYRTTHTPAWYQPESSNKESDKAWLMYQAARDNHLGLLVLGKGDIRSDPDMVTNFGYTSVHGRKAAVPNNWPGKVHSVVVQLASIRMNSITKPWDPVAFSVIKAGPPC